MASSSRSSAANVVIRGRSRLQMRFCLKSKTRRRESFERVTPNWGSSKKDPKLQSRPFPWKAQVEEAKRSTRPPHPASSRPNPGAAPRVREPLEREPPGPGHGPGCGPGWPLRPSQPARAGSRRHRAFRLAAPALRGQAEDTGGRAGGGGGAGARDRRARPAAPEPAAPGVPRTLGCPPPAPPSSRPSATEPEPEPPPQPQPRALW